MSDTDTAFVPQQAEPEDAEPPRLIFNAVSRKAPAREPVEKWPTHKAGYLEARDFFTEEYNEGQNLEITFPTVEERDAFVRLCRKLAERDGWKFRAVSAVKGETYLKFRMESADQREKRIAEVKKKREETEQRRAAGENIPGRKPKATGPSPAIMPGAKKP